MTQPFGQDRIIDRSLTTSPYRIGDVERTRTCDVLAEHYAAGRLSGEELERRLECAVQAVSAAELARLTADLPPGGHDGTRMDPPTASRTWPTGVVVALVAFLVSVFVAGGMVLALGLVSPLLVLGAGLGGCAAAVGGAAAMYLLIAFVRRAQQPAAGRCPGPR